MRNIKGLYTMNFIKAMFAKYVKLELIVCSHFSYFVNMSNINNFVQILRLKELEYFYNPKF